MASPDIVDYSILTPERVSLQYDVAGIGSRGAALLVDGLIQGAVFAVFVVLLAAVGALLREAALNFFLLGLWVVAVFLLWMGYFPLFEVVWNGQTPGKRLLGLRVIRETGYPIRPVDAVIRNILRLVDILPGFYAVGVITMFLNQRSKRLGDFAAGTIVVREGAVRGITPPWLAHADGSPAVALASEDATLVRDFLVRRSSMDPASRAALAHCLATALARRYGLVIEPEAEAFLEHLSS